MNQNTLKVEVLKVLINQEPDTAIILTCPNGIIEFSQSTGTTEVPIDVLHEAITTVFKYTIFSYRVLPNGTQYIRVKDDIIALTGSTIQTAGDE